MHFYKQYCFGMITKRSVLGVMATVVLFVALSAFVVPYKATEPLPGRLTDDAFWKIVTGFSEEEGYFRFENFLSNEMGFQRVIPGLKEIAKSGGVYLGVGPEQNFTYIAALQPKIAFIIDIRRQNMIEHLMYKALFELSSDRADFLSRLYARKRPGGLNADVDSDVLFAGYERLQRDPALAEENLSAIKQILRNHKFALSKEDFDTIGYVYSVFVESGPDLDYNVGGFGGGGGSPTYEQLMTATDKAGRNWSYLATEGNYRTMRDMELRNLIIPLVGDFAGPKAIRAVAEYLVDHDVRVTAFYLSNVERYLFQDSTHWRRFYRNISALPVDSSSTFIRSVNAGAYGRIGGYGMRFQSLLSSMPEAVKAFDEGRIRYYNDVIRMSR